MGVGLRSAQRADFLFVGLAVLPVALAFGDFIELAMLAFVPLLLAACFAGMWEQIESCCGSAQQAGGETLQDRPPEGGAPRVDQKP